MDVDERALAIWNQARAAAMTSGVYPEGVITTILLSKCVALLETLVEQTAKEAPEPVPLPNPTFAGHRIAGIPNAK